MKKNNYALPGSHDYSDENFDMDLYKSSINVTDIEATQLINGSVMFAVDFEFLAQYADGQRWIKDASVIIGEPGPALLSDFKQSLIKWVKQAREELANTHLNGKKAE